MRLGPYQYLADMVVMHYHNSSLNDVENKQRRRCLVAIAGGLGSGKSTIAGHVRDRVEEQGLKCQVVTVEGFLRPRADLSEEQLNKRGAIDTLDGDAVLHMVQDLRDSRPGEDVHLPGFDEHTRETVPDGQVIQPDTQVVIIKGTYILANAQPWRKIGGLVDERWFVFVMPDVARERGARQYLDKGIVGTEEEAFRRYDEIGVYTNNPPPDQITSLDTVQKRRILMAAPGHDCAAMICSVFLPKLSQPPLRFSPGAPSPTTASQLRFLPASAQGLCALPAVLQWASCAYLDPTLNLDLDFDLDFPNVPPPSRSLNLCLLQSQSSGPFPYIPIRLFFPSRHQPTMPPRDPPPHMRVLLEAIQQEYGTTNVFEAMTRQQSLAPKWVRGHKLLRDDPSQWFRGTQIDDRDLALINAGPVPWINIGQQSYLKHVHHKIKDQPFETTHWTVENDKALRDMISEVGAGFTGWAKPLVLPTRDWESMLVNVTVTGNIAPGVTWGLLSGRPSKARVLAGPCSTCPEHPWDIMILRDFHTNTSGLDQVSSIASRQFDILLMKMCEDMDYPWVVLAVKDSGPWNPQPCSSNGHCDNSCLGF